MRDIKQIPQSTSTSKYFASLNDLELTSIKALLTYTAEYQNVNEAIVEEIVKTHFDVKEVELLPSQSFDDIIKFMVNIQINIILN